VARTAKADHLGELIVAVLELRGPMEARQLIEPISMVDSMRHYTIASLGQIAGATPGVVKVRLRPRAIFDLEEGRRTKLPSKTHRRLLLVLGENLPPTGGANLED
jgi:hypothetical protein